MVCTRHGSNLQPYDPKSYTQVGPRWYVTRRDNAQTRLDAGGARRVPGASQSGRFPRLEAKSCKVRPERPFLPSPLARSKFVIMLERYPAPSFERFGTNWDKILAKMAYLSVINEIGIVHRHLKLCRLQIGSSS